MDSDDQILVHTKRIKTSNEKLLEDEKSYMLCKTQMDSQLFYFPLYQNLKFLLFHLYNKKENLLLIKV